MSLEKFAKQQILNWPAAAIRKNGTISINRMAVEQFNLKEKRFATLHFDRKETLMGIKLLDDDKDPSAFRIAKEKNRRFVISCQSFLKHCEIPYKAGSRIYRAGWDEKRGMILLKIG
jgi:hypothetical protein